MSIIVNDGDSTPINVHNIVLAKSKTIGSMVSWQASGGRAQGKIEQIKREGTLSIPNSSFNITAEKDDPAVLIRIYRDGKPTDTLVGHKMSTLQKSEVTKHGSHDQSRHGRGGKGGAGAGAGGASGELDDAEAKMDAGYKEIVVGAGPNPSSNPRVMDAGQMREDALNRTTDARDFLARGDKSGAASALRDASSRLKGEPKFDAARQALTSLATKVGS